jgi:hypothetical protein
MEPMSIEYKQFSVSLLGLIFSAAFVYAPYGSSDAIFDLPGDTDVAKYSGIGSFICSAVTAGVALVRLQYKETHILKTIFAFFVVATPTLMLCSFIAYEDAPKSEIAVPIVLLILSWYAYAAIAYNLKNNGNKLLSPLWSQFV